MVFACGSTANVAGLWKKAPNDTKNYFPGVTTQLFIVAALGCVALIKTKKKTVGSNMLTARLYYTSCLQLKAN